MISLRQSSVVSAKPKTCAECSLGQTCILENRVRIGDNVKIQNNVSAYDNLTLEDDVFCGPSMVFTNVYNPPSAVSRKDEYRNTLVKHGAILGTNSPSFVALQLVRRDVPDFALIVGNAGKQMGRMSRYGERIELPLSGEAPQYFRMLAIPVLEATAKFGSVKLSLQYFCLTSHLKFHPSRARRRDRLKSNVAFPLVLCETEPHGITCKQCTGASAVPESIP